MTSTKNKLKKERVRKGERNTYPTSYELIQQVRDSWLNGSKSLRKRTASQH